MFVRAKFGFCKFNSNPEENFKHYIITARFSLDNSFFQTIAMLGLPRVLLACLLVGVSLSADLTRVERSSGPEVVEAVVNIIRESCLFADDKRFLRRLAYVESEDGMLPKTYRTGYNGGIWQVS